VDGMPRYNDIGLHIATPHSQAVDVSMICYKQTDRETILISATVPRSELNAPRGKN